MRGAAVVEVPTGFQTYPRIHRRTMETAGGANECRVSWLGGSVWCWACECLPLHRGAAS